MLKAILNGLGAVGNVLDLPGSMVRDTLAGQNPFDQLATPFSDQNRYTGRDLLRHYGMAGQGNTWGNFAGGLAAETLLDPTNLIGTGYLKNVLKNIRSAKTANRGLRAANEIAMRHPAMISPSMIGREAAEEIAPVVRGYIPDLTHEKIPGATMRDLTGEEYTMRAYGDLGRNSPEYRNAMNARMQHEADVVYGRKEPYRYENDKRGEYVVQRLSPALFGDPETRDVALDTFRGLNAGHALRRAAENWDLAPGETVRLMGKAEDTPYFVGLQTEQAQVPLNQFADNLVRVNPEIPLRPVPKMPKGAIGALVLNNILKQQRNRR